MAIWVRFLISANSETVCSASVCGTEPLRPLSWPEGSEVRGKLAATTICTLANFRPADGQGIAGRKFV